MIPGEDILQVGRTQKPYGIRGEIIILFRKAEYADLDTEFYFLEIEGIPVPFFVEEFTYTTDTSARVKFEDVNDEKQASRYVNTDVFLSRDIVSAVRTQSSDDWEFFVGYSIVDQYGETIGTIREVDSTTINVLFVVEKDGSEYLIPATEDFIVAVDEGKKLLEMYLPEGLTEE
ncbi:ribosome maturation factor RimM [Proteiniphilum sp. UBA1028]|jgi:16S rRNA processing protein RimM|uniref:ribosome maturation factor RimM n=1 Tax=Proteiniphilum sp. UBA1028 TaxID=1947251 RepID=UPI000E9DD176|nr:ribosome maturation factor RimM [Proteiniphilum sp. UBA1028]HBG59143.1 16S rRNA processing protein RimM [Porphyromonadaceae bacterium]